MKGKPLRGYLLELRDAGTSRQISIQAGSTEATSKILSAKRPAYLEKNRIALLSNFGKPPFDRPSSNWLGRSSPERPIRESGLWNTNYVNSDYDAAFLPMLDDFVRV